MATEGGLRRRMKGLSEATFAERFGTVEACRKTLFELRWGKGWGGLRRELQRGGGVNGVAAQRGRRHR